MDQNSEQKNFGSVENQEQSEAPVTAESKDEVMVASETSTPAEGMAVSEKSEPVIEPTSTEQPLEEESKSQEELPTAEETPEVEEPKVDTSNFTTEELMAYLTNMIDEEKLPDLQDMKRLKRLINNDTPVTNDEEELDDVEDNGEERDASKPVDNSELLTAFLNLKTCYHELSAKKSEEEKLQREENYKKKQELIKRLEDNLHSTDDFFKVRNEFENIRAEWKETGPVPDNLRSELVTKYSRLLDEYYNINKLNKEAQEYDYKHNRKEKEEFIAKAKALSNETDVVKAFRELQTLHDLWKETGPVAPEFRDAMWAEFSEASKVINRAHDEYFKKLHEQEEENYTKRIQVVERLENMLIKLPNTREGWRQYERELDQIRADWKEAGRVPKAKVNELRIRFRVAVDEFYLQRRNFMKELSEQITPKLERMRELVAEAEALKDSTDWRATTKKLQELQKEWTANSQLGTRVAEAQRLWRRFRSACDHFFKNKAEVHKQRVASREENLEKKILIAAKLEELYAKRLEDPSEELAAIEEEWAAVGPVPNDQKDEVLNRYYGTLRRIKGGGRPLRQRDGQHRDRNRKDRDGGRRTNRAPKVNMQKDLTELDAPQLQDEGNIIQRNIAQLEEELLQYETNIGFFNASPDNPMVMQIQAKIDRLKEKIGALQARLKEVKEEIKNPTPAKAEANSEEDDAPSPTEETATAEQLQNAEELEGVVTEAEETAEESQPTTEGTEPKPEE